MAAAPSLGSHLLGILNPSLNNILDLLFGKHRFIYNRFPVGGSFFSVEYIIR